MGTAEPAASPTRVEMSTAPTEEFRGVTAPERATPRDPSATPHNLGANRHLTDASYTAYADNVDGGRLTARLDLVVVNGSGALGGAESWLLSLLDAAADRLKIRFVLLADGPLRHELMRRGIAVTLRHTGARTRDVAAAVFWLRRQLSRHDPELVLANGVKAAAVACPAARLAGVRSVWVKHDVSRDRTLARPLAKLATRVVAVSDEVAAAARRSDTAIIPPPRPVAALSPDEARHTLAAIGVNLPRAGKSLAMLGRIAPNKGFDTAIEALADQPKWHLAIIGPDDPAHPEERERLAKLAAEHGVAHRVQIGDYLPNAGQTLSAFDALAVLTRPVGKAPGIEGYGLTAAEAMTAGIPVIVAGDGPVARRIGDDGTGVVAGLRIDHQPGALSDALGFLGSTALAEAMGAEGKRRMATEPDPASSGQRLANVLAETALRPGAGRRTGPPLSVIVPIFNEGQVIDDLMRLVGPQLGRDDELILIDGGSTDNTTSIVAGYQQRDPRIKLIDDAGGNIAHSRNVGIRAARYPFVACTDAGCDPNPQWLASFRAAAADTTGTDVGMVLGVYHVGIRPKRPFEKAMAAVAWADPVELRRPTPARVAYAKLFGRWFLAHRVEGRSVGFTKAAFEAAGGFPEYLATAEDEAFGKKLIAAGHRSIHSLDAHVIWYQRPSVASTFRQFKGYGLGGGTSRSALLLVRDAVRVAAYGVAIALPLMFGVAGWIATGIGAAAYLSLPVARLVRRRHPLWLLPALPLCYLLKDVAKVIGTAQALLRGIR